MVAPTCGAAALTNSGAGLRGDMLQDHAQAGKLFHPSRQPAIDEHRFAVENVDVGTDLLAVHEKRHVDLLHALQHAGDIPIIGDAGRRIGCGVRRVKLHPCEHAVAETALHIVGVGVVGEVASHQRLKARPRRQRRLDPLAVGHRVARGAHRRRQVRHQDGAAEILGGVRQHGLEHFAVADVQVPVVGPADGDARSHRGASNHRFHRQAMPLP